MKLNDTIAAIATPRGLGGIAIVRISGKCAEEISAKIVEPYGAKQVCDLESHKLTLCRVFKKDRDFLIDEALVAVMRAPKSYTGETVVEINCHGGYLAADKILTELLKCGARLAEAGEFTRRAFINGKTDLNGAEAVMDLMNAHSESGLHNAAMSLTGKLSEKIFSVREKAMEIAAHISAVADYPDEVDPPENGELLTSLDDIKKEIDNLLKGFDTGRIMRDGAATAIVGKPNVGKSSILNALLRFERAIVTDIPGTTRDTIEEYINVGGIALKLMDTAGIRKASDEVEKIGIKRSKESVDSADLCLFVVDSAAELSEEDKEVADALDGKKTILIMNKTDKQEKITENQVRETLKINPDAVIRTAAPKGETAVGIDALESLIADMFANGKISMSDVYISNERQRDCLLKAYDAVKRAEISLKTGAPFDLLFIDLEDVISALGEVTGETVQEEIIDKVFASFCVGK